MYAIACKFIQCVQDTYMYMNSIVMHPQYKDFQFPLCQVCGCDHKNSHFLMHLHVCCNPVCRFMPLILLALRGLTTLGRLWSGESTPLTLNRCLDPSTRGIAFF